MDQSSTRRPGESPIVKSNKRSIKSFRRLGSLTIIVLLLLVLGGGVGIIMRYKTSQKLTYSNDIKKNQFQAIFLTNGQVYFGKINSIGPEYMKLGNVYYLQVQQSVQPSTDNKAAAQSTTAANQNLSLAKLGGELHGPEDSMYIAQKQVLFWENMKDDSQVVKAIKAVPNK